MGSVIKVNGRTFRGKDVMINNSDVIIDGKKVDLGQELNITVVVEGEVKSIEGARSVTVNGSVGSVKTQSGDVNCGDVHGSVSTMSGDVTAAKISGNVSTMSGAIIQQGIPRQPPVPDSDTATAVE